MKGMSCLRGRFLRRRDARSAPARRSIEVLPTAVERNRTMGPLPQGRHEWPVAMFVSDDFVNSCRVGGVCDDDEGCPPCGKGACGKVISVRL